MKINEFQKIKGRPLITSGPNETVHTAIQKLVENNIGSLPVCGANGTLLGIVTERDLLKECAQRSMAIGSTKVKDIMTKEVAIGIPEDDMNYVMEVMIQKGINKVSGKAKMHHHGSSSSELMHSGHVEAKGNCCQ